LGLFTDGRKRHSGAGTVHTDKKEIKFSSYKEIQNGAVAKSYFD
jgi:hypothetical protein